MISRVLLFDIDGTMLTSGGSGQRAMEQVLRDHFGVPEIKCDIPAAGRTDRAIITDLFRVHDLEFHDHHLEKFQLAYFNTLPLHLQNKTGCVLGGVHDLLNHLKTINSVKLGLLTGNFREGARIKLSSFQLDHFFEFGGYGDHHHSRDDVARDAWSEVLKLCHSEFSPQNVWVIGDTPADIACARAIGAKVLAVSTGIYNFDQLAAHDPDFLVENLSDLALLQQVLLADS